VLRSVVDYGVKTKLLSADVAQKIEALLGEPAAVK